MKLTVYYPHGGTVFEIDAADEQKVMVAARAITETMGNEDLIPLLRRGYYFLRNDDGSTVRQGMFCENERMLP